MGIRDVAVLIKVGDSVRNDALVLRITLRGIGGLGEILGPWANSALYPRAIPPNIGGLNPIIGFRS